MVRSITRKIFEGQRSPLIYLKPLKLRPTAIASMSAVSRRDAASNRFANATFEICR